MPYTILSLPIVLPVIFWALYHYDKDRHLPEPVTHLLLAFALGVASAYLASLMYWSLGLVGLRFNAFALAESHPWGLLAYAILAIGMIEELAKLIPFLLIIVHFREFNEPIDGIIYASFIALGFAAVENTHYVSLLSNLEAYARGFAGPVVHIVFASIWAYHIGKAWLCRRHLARTIFAAVGFTALLHGLYDFVVIAMPPWALPVAALLIAIPWIWRLSLLRDLHSAPPDRC
jgi:RsiW-degrading membrane proteinase PrsW (M82 family)